MGLAELETAWNSKADEFSSWQELGLDEIVVFAQKVEREACVSICREVAERYPTDIFPDAGSSADCKSARMARLTAANIEREIAERHNVGPAGGFA